MRLLQKILSHGLLIAFIAAAILLYLYRSDVFPHWFGEGRVPIAEQPASGSTPEDVASSQSKEPDQADNHIVVEAQPDTAGPGEQVDLPPVANETAPETLPGEEPQQKAEVEALPPLVSAPEAQPDTAGSGEQVDLPPVANETAPETLPGEEPQRKAEVEALPPLASAPEVQPETHATEEQQTSDLPPMGHATKEAAGNGESVAAALPPLKSAEDQEVQMAPAPADVAVHPDAGKTRGPASPAATEVGTTELPPSAPATEAYDQEPAVETAPPEVQAEGTAPPQPGDTGVTAMPSTSIGGPQQSKPEFRTESADKAAANWGAPEEPEKSDYRPLGQTPDEAVGWPSGTQGDSDSGATVSEEAQYRPESSSAESARQLQVGDEPAAAAPPAEHSEQDYESRLSDARQHFWTQDLQAAVSMYQGLTQDYPTHADAWGELGNVNFRLGQWQAAAQAYATAVGLLADQGENERARHLLQILYGLDANRAAELEGRLK
jgi:hypothetical protein